MDLQLQKDKGTNFKETNNQITRENYVAFISEKLKKDFE